MRPATVLHHTLPPDYWPRNNSQMTVIRNFWHWKSEEAFRPFNYLFLVFVPAWKSQLTNRPRFQHSSHFVDLLWPTLTPKPTRRHLTSTVKMFLSLGNLHPRNLGVKMSESIVQQVVLSSGLTSAPLPLFPSWKKALRLAFLSYSNFLARVLHPGSLVPFWVVPQVWVGVGLRKWRNSVVGHKGLASGWA